MQNKLHTLCRIAFRFIGIYKTKTITILCNDFRLFKGTLKLYRSLGIESPDEIKIPGGPMSLARNEKLACQWLQLLYKLHEAEEVYLIAHTDCGAYMASGFEFDDASEEFAFHKAELKKAGDKVKTLIPSIKKVVLIYARFSRDQRLLEYVKIE